MRAVIIIALNTFRENLRDKILYILLIFAALLMGASILLGALTIAEQEKIIADMGLASINVIGVIIAIFVGIGLVSKEIERRTIYTILAKPISRSQFILGKYLGLIITLGVNLVIMFDVFLFTLWMTQVPITVVLVQAAGLMMVEFMVVTATAMFFSTFSTPTLSAALTLGLYLIGHLTSDLKALAEKSSSEVTKAVMTALYYLCPNLEVLNIKGQAVSGVSLAWSYQVSATLYGLFYASLLVAGAAAIFQKRDF
jgi:ABC-type transport system involved in multi-copper enzyme maturation permease subunit